MILLVHMLFGAAIGYKIYSLTNNLWLATASAFLAHYFLDIFPHIEYLQSVETSIKKIKDKLQHNLSGDIFKINLDFFLGIIFIFIFSKNQLIIYLFSVVAIIPDALTVVTLLSPNKILLLHHKLHAEKIHFLKYKKISNFWRILTQVLAVIISIILLRFFK